MAYVNSALHPILYICASGQFNKQYQVVKWKLGCRRTAYGSHQNSVSILTLLETYVFSNVANDLTAKSLARTGNFSRGFVILKKTN